jgi:hypothetical protein
LTSLVVGFVLPSNGPEALKKYEGDKAVLDAYMVAAETIQKYQEEQQTAAAAAAQVRSKSRGQHEELRVGGVVCLIIDAWYCSKQGKGLLEILKLSQGVQSNARLLCCALLLKEDGSGLLCCALLSMGAVTRY